MSICRFIKWLHYEFPISCPAASWHTQYSAALALDECRIQPWQMCFWIARHYRSSLWLHISTHSNGDYKPVSLCSFFFLKVRSDLVVHSKRLLLILFLPVFGLYCIYSMNIQTTPNRKTKARLIPRGRQTCASPHRSPRFIHVVRLALLRMQPHYTTHYIKQVQFIIVMFGSNRCLETTKQQRITAVTRDVFGMFYQAVQVN